MEGRILDRIVRRTASACLLGACILFAVGPLFWQLSTSLRLEKEYYTGLTLLPRQWTLANYAKALRATKIGAYFLNSAAVTSLSTLFTVAVSSLGAYSLSRFRYPGARILRKAIVGIYMFPPILFLIPIYLVIYHLGLLDTRASLILCYTTFSMPFSLMLLFSFFQTIPRELDESGRIDGAGNGRILLSIVLPLSLPGLATVAIFTSISSWNEFLYALTFVLSEGRKTLSAGFYLLLKGDMLVDWGQMMAMATLAQVPMLAFFVLYGKGLVRGLTAGAVKG